MKLAKIIENDIVDCDDGICVSVWFRGCPHRCKGCQNEELWEFDGDEVELNETTNKVIELINKNEVQRKLSILGGEPLCKENRKDVALLIHKVRNAYPWIKIFLWTGYTLEELKADIDDDIKYVLSKIDVLIDGRYVEELRDVSLKLRGSSNQRILYKGKDF